MLVHLQQLPLTLVEASQTHARLAAEIKAVHPVAYGDCFAAALARIEDCPVLTGDPEFEHLTEVVEIQWTRPPTKKR